MHVVKIHRILPFFSIKYRNSSTLANEEYTATPQYPPILDLKHEAKKIRKVESWSKVIENLKTVEEKQMKLNEPRYYGWKAVMLNDQSMPYNAMNLVQHCTRTHFKEVQELPKYHSDINVEAISNDLKSLIEDALALEYGNIKRSYEIYNQDIDEASKENIISDSIINQINRIILNNITFTTPHLSDIQIDFNPRHEAFWFVGGINPPNSVKNFRERFPWTEHMANDPVDRTFQYMGKPSLAIRNTLPLEPIISHQNSESQEFDVPVYKFDPRVLGFNTTHRHGTNIPGFWPGDSYEFGLLSFQNRGYMLSRKSTFGKEDNQEALHCQGMTSCFAWLLAQASYQGFTTYNDVTYPLTAQTIITNGKEWSFYVYQLNTTLIHSDFITNNPKRNICWGTPVLKLFEQIDENGKVIGFNDNVLKQILKFYTNVPKLRDGVNMKPYLGEAIKVVADIEDDEKRAWLEKYYKHMMSNRPRHRSLYEIYHWEQIYKINNKTRAREARHRPFELEVNPWKRRYNETSPVYIPRVLRPGGPKSKPKFYKSYFP